MRSKSLSEIRSQKGFSKIWFEHKKWFFFWPSISPMRSMIKFIPQSSTMNWRRQMTQLCIKRSQNFSEENYRPISIVPNISKIYERWLYDQISNFFEVVFSKYQCGFLKGYSAQQCLLVMIENWKKIVDHGGVFGTLLTGLSITFDVCRRMTFSLQKWNHIVPKQIN